MFGGYVGHYKDFILKSSYEYIYCKILEFDNINYIVEKETYMLDEGQTYYTPDFFLFNEKKELYKIVEIRGHRLNIKERIESVSKLKEILDESIEVELYTEIDLRKMCRERGLSYEKLKIEWRTNPNNIKGSSKGKSNSMYGKEQKESTKQLLSQKGKERYKDNPELHEKTTKKLIKWCRENNYNFLRGERVPRYVLICQYCGKEFKVIQGKKDKRKFCSPKCSSMLGSSMGRNISIKKRKERDEELKKSILTWSLENKEIVLNTPYNKIESSLSQLYEIIEKDFKVIDKRTITRSFGTSSRKEFLTILKEYVTKHTNTL